MNHSLTTDLNIRLIVIMVFFVALAFGARKRMLDLKDMIIAGTILVVASSAMLFDAALKVTIGMYGHNQKAFLYAAGTISPFILSLLIAMVIIVRRMKSDGGGKTAQPKTVGKKTLASRASASVDTEVSKPKPRRVKGNRRRF